VVNAIGLKESTMLNFHFDNVKVEAATAGDINFGQNWQWNNSQISTKDNTAINVKNATGNMVMPVSKANN
jgi:hypothetical protein